MFAGNETSIEQTGDFNGELATALRHSMQEALALKSGLQDWLLELPGMSGRSYRRCINNIVRNVRLPRYLEVGSWAGSTACSAMFGNAAAITCIDNWAEFGGPRDEFNRTTSAARSDDIDFRFLESDFRTIDYSSLEKFNIYLYDGPHGYKDHFDGIALPQPALAETYIQVVDDWNWPYVRSGTADAMAASGLGEICSIQILTTQDDTHPAEAIGEGSAWHNGCYFGVLSRV